MMREDEFYNLINVLEKAGPDALPSGLRGWQPSVEELDASVQKTSAEELLPVLTYFAIHGTGDLKKYCSRAISSVCLSA